MKILSWLLLFAFALAAIACSNQQSIAPCDGCSWQFRSRNLGDIQLCSAEVLKDGKGIASFNAASIDGAKTVDRVVIKWSGSPAQTLIVAEERGQVGIRKGVVFYVEETHGSLKEIMSTARELWDAVRKGKEPDTELQKKIKRFLYEEKYHPEWFEDSVPPPGTGSPEPLPGQRTG